MRELKTPVVFDDDYDIVDADGYPLLFGADMVDHHPEIAREIAQRVNAHEKLVVALRAALEYIEQSPCDPDIYPKQLEARGELTSLQPHKLLSELEAAASENGEGEAE